ncbi:MAG: M48 family metalloprotease [Ignavibacteriales bacterium]|nr:M48 family metalloprotease [Ignavibacteriales bacterium]
MEKGKPRSVRVTVVAVVLSTFSLSCSGSLGINLFPDSKDIQLGKEIDQEIRKNGKEYPLLKDRPDVKSYVEAIGRKILGSPDITKRGIYAYQFEIIRDDSTINAFCTPGGYIYVYTGLLKFVDNEATLAGVIGHEIAHAERRHATRRMTTALGYQIVLSVLLGGNPGETEKIAGNLFTGLALLRNSRGDEEEADNHSIKYLRSTEYYPGAIRFFFEKIGGVGNRGGAFQRFLSTHPLPQDRVDNVEKQMQLSGNPQPTDANLFLSRYADFKSRLP